MTAIAAPRIVETSPLTKTPRLIVFSDDWDRHPSSSQHLVRRLLDDHSVLWVNTIGMRRPGFDMTTLRRGAARIGEWMTGKPRTKRNTTDADNVPTVVAPRMWPSFRHEWERRLNAGWLARQVTNFQSNLDEAIGITTVPIVADLVERLPLARWVYYRVDDFSHWPGLDGRTMREMENKLMRKVDLVIAASQALGEEPAKIGVPTELLTHGVDLDHWSRAAEERPVKSPRTILFFGLIDERLDVDWLRALDSRLNGATLELRGPCQSSPLTSEMLNCHLAEPVPYQTLPQFVAKADVLVMPYVDSELTRAMQPLKLLEYLASGKPVVVRDLPAVKPWQDCLDVAHSATEFRELVQLRLETGLPEPQRLARQRLANESWDAKAERFRNWIVNSPTTPSTVC